MLHARDAGRGRVVVLLHAFPLNSRMWEPQFAGLQGEARLIAPDFPGFGLSGAPNARVSLDDYAAEVVALLDHLRIEHVVVAGLSMGGYVAFRLVERLQGRLYGLLLADTRPTADTQEAVLARHELAAEVEAQGVVVAADEFVPKLLGNTSLRVQPGLMDRVRAIVLENSVAGVAGALRAMAARVEVGALLPRIRCPVVCLAGEEDTITPPEVARAMAERIPSARAEIIPQAGHLTNMEAPQEFNDALVTLLAQSYPG